jgi:hypothetical protein
MTRLIGEDSALHTVIMQTSDDTAVIEFIIVV